MQQGLYGWRTSATTTSWTTSNRVLTEALYLIPDPDRVGSGQPADPARASWSLRLGSLVRISTWSAGRACVGTEQPGYALLGARALASA